MQHQFEVDDRVYILYPQNGQTQKFYGTVRDTWSSGRYVDIQFDGQNYTWPFMAIHVFHEDHETTQEVVNHVNC